ncbi:YPDG domain-containing protein, partial [Streptococcus sp. 121]|uniref:Rib/alpha-like domain-containing protein n=1 Tax=Streptococcus sp. 121 TaxID=2797637 RepID=UPI0018F0606E
MYFNRKGAKQTNWRMIKKGKHFLFGCSLVLALGATTTVAASDVAIEEKSSSSSESEFTLAGDVSLDSETKDSSQVYNVPAVVLETEEVSTSAPSSEEKVEENLTTEETKATTTPVAEEKPVVPVEEVKDETEVKPADQKTATDQLVEKPVAPQSEVETAAPADLSTRKERIIRGLEKLKHLPSTDREDYAKLIDSATTIGELQNLQSQANQANALLYLEKTRAQRESEAASVENTAFRKVTTDVYKAALAEIRGLSNLNSVEIQYYTAELNKLTKGIINRDKEVTALLEKARKMNELYASNRGTTQADAILNTVSASDDRTVSGNVRLTSGGRINTDEDTYNQPLEGVEVYAQWYEKNGFASPIYKTVTNADGSFAIGLHEFIGADGKLYQFNANPQSPSLEKWRIWSINPDTNKYSLLYSYGEEQISPEGIILDASAGAGQNVTAGKLENVEIRYAHKTDDVWKQDAKETPALTSGSGSGGRVSGAVYWNNYNPAGGQLWNDLVSRQSDYDRGLENVTVYASYLTDWAVKHLNSPEVMANFVDESSEWKPTYNAATQEGNIRSIGSNWTRVNENKLREYILEQVKDDRSKWVAETVSAKTDAKGEFNIQFNGTYGQAWNNAGADTLIQSNKSVLLNEADVTSATGETRKGTEWFGEVAHDATYGQFGSTGNGSRLDLSKAPKHINMEWMMITTDKEGVSFVNPFYGDVPKGPLNISNRWGTQGVGTGTAWGVDYNLGTTLIPGNNDVSNVRFAAFHDDLTFDIVNYDSAGNFAGPGDTARTSTIGVTPVGNETYEIVWKDEEGKEVGTSGPIRPNATGELPESTYTVPSDLTKTTTYFAELYALNEDGSRPDYPMQKDSFTAVYRELPVYKVTEGVQEQSADSETPTFDLAHTEEVEERPVPAGASFALVSDTGDETVEGFTIDAKTGVITWTNPQKDTEVTVEVTYADGTTAITVAKFVLKKADNEKYEPSYEEKNVVPGTPATSTPSFTGADGNATTAPEGSKFAIAPDFNAPEGYTVTIDENTGEVTVTAPASPIGETAETVTVPVVVTYPDATTDSVNAVFNLDSDGDNTPDKDDEDDDNDGIPDTDESKDGTNPKDPNSAASSIKAIEDQTVEQGNAINPVTVTGEKVPNGGSFKVDGLPNGVIFDSTTNTISGTPTAAGESTVTVTVLDKNGNPVKDSNGKPVTEEFKITVSEKPEQADTNEPSPVEQTVKVGETPTAENSIGNVSELPEGTTFAYETPVDTETAGDKPATVVVTYPDGSVDKVNVTVKVAENPTQADTNEPTSADQTVKVGETPTAENSIGNVSELPEGTTFAYETPVDTATAGDKPATVVVTYPDGSVDKVNVTVKVAENPTQADTNEPTSADQTVKVGETPTAENSIGNVSELPEGTTFTYETPVDTTTAGDKPAVVVVTYPDKSQDKVNVTVKVENLDADKYTPEVETEFVIQGSEFDLTDNLKPISDDTGNQVAIKVEDVTPKGDVDTTKPGNYTGKVKVTYPDGSSEIVDVPVIVVDQEKDPSDADKYEPTAKPEEVAKGGTVDLTDNVDPITDGNGNPVNVVVKDVTPEGAIDTNTPGDYTGKVEITYPDGSTETIDVPVKVVENTPAKTDADKYEPTAKPEEVAKGGTVDLTDNVDPITDENGNPVNVVVKDVTPEGAIDTNTPGDYTGKVEITYPDGSTETIDVPVKVVENTPAKTDADKYEPTAKPEEVAKGGTVDLTDNVDPITDEN